MTAHIVRRRLRATSGVVLPLGATNLRTGTFYAGNAGPKTAVAAAVAAAMNDTITVNPGTYNLDQISDGAIRLYASLTLQSAVPGQLAVFTSNGANMNLFHYNIGGTVVTLDGIGLHGNRQEEYGSTVAGLYSVAAGQVCTLNVRRCKVWECNQGILGSAGDTAGTVVIEDSEFYDNGNNAAGGTGFTHSLYLSGASVTLRGVWVHNVYDRTPGNNVYLISWGNLVKSRAAITIIEGCRLGMQLGEANRCIDLPNGGKATIRGNLLEMLATANSNGGGQAISFGVEEAGNPLGLTEHEFRFEQNTLVNHNGQWWGGSNTRNFLWMRTDASGVPAPTVYSVKDNVFAGITGALMRSPDTYGAEGNVYEPSAAENTIISAANMNSMMPGHAAMDFTLATPVTGAQNWAPWAYVHPAAKVARTDNKRGGVPG